MVGLRSDELVYEIPLGAHDLDAVIARGFRETRATRVGEDGAADPPCRERARSKWRDRRLDPGRRDGEGVIGIAPRMQDLQRDLAAGGMHRFGDDAVLADLP